MNNIDANSRRLFFVKGEDYYFLAYNTMILLHELGYKKREGTNFRDVKKLSFLIDFVSNEQLLSIVEDNKNKNDISSNDKELLKNSFTRSYLRIDHVNRMIYSLNRSKFLSVDDSRKKGEIIDVSLSGERNINVLLNSNEYKQERENSKRLSSEIKRLGLLKIDTMLNRIYKNFGVSIWQEF